RMNRLVLHCSEMIVRFLQILVLLTLTFALNAQRMSGIVYDAEDSTPIPFVVIYLVESDATTSADSLGRFEISAPQLPSFHLRFVSLGYETKTAVYSTGSGRIEARMFPKHLDLHEVTVSGALAQSQSENPFHIESRKIDDLTAISAMNMGEAIARIPGVYQSRLGNGIAKPVVRGMQGMRVVTLMNGLRIESQQWGGDHGMGITDLGLGNVEVIKGPASLLYGADALAGVVYFNDEAHAPIGKRELDTKTLFQSNTMGVTQRMMYRESRERVRWQIGAGYANHADFKLPSGRFAQNSRFNEAVLKSVFSFNGKRSVHHLRYTFSNTTTGIPGHTHDTTATPESFQVETQRRSYTLPAQFFNNHFFSFDNKWFRENSEFQFMAGMTSNRLIEYDEKVTIPSLSMSLLNALYTAKWISRFFDERLKLIAGVQGMHQWNVNALNDSDRLVPDSKTIDQGAYLTTQYGSARWNIQSGIRYDVRFLQAYETDGETFGKSYQGINASAGGVFHAEWVTFRASYSSGYRAPHLTELLSNGFHHGALRYEVGNRELKPEYARQADVTIELTGDHLVFLYNPFVNKIRDYIYLQPLGYNVDGIPAFAYDVLSDITFFGNDVGFHYHPHFAHELHVETTWSYIQTFTPADSSVSLLPPQRIQSSLKYSFENRRKFGLKEVNVMHTFMDAQKKVAFMELPSNSYHLLDVALAFEWKAIHRWELRLGVKNILNERYIDHLSRLKNIEMPAPGRNIYLSIQFKI
ncbi:MAG: TonB-dependent receptor domain-containing protein, partial [Flavobacteriales bacterium]